MLRMLGATLLGGWPDNCPGLPPIARRPLPAHPQATEPTAVLAALMTVMLMIGFTALVLAAQAGGPPAAPNQRPVEGRVGVHDAPAVGHAESPAPAATVAPMTEPAVPPLEPTQAEPSLAIDRRARVVNTAGRGVILHTEPRRGARGPAGLLEGAQVTVLEQAATDWARVQSEQGQVGWVPTEYLASIN